MASAITATAAIIYASLFWYANGQIPGPCAENVKESIKRCCPNDCGANEQPPRGKCVNISEIVPELELNPTVTDRDPRGSWPHFFNELCKCEGNYGGYNCLECQFGYRGKKCDEFYMRTRKSVTELTNTEREEYLDALKSAKNDSYDRYMAIADNGDPPNIVPVPLYDLLVWMHFYIGRENARLNNRKYPKARDYAHESGAFPTWHRLFLLFAEREIQNLIGNDSFTLPYWDWSKESNRDFLFNNDWLGSRKEGGRVGGYFGDVSNWKTVCWHGKKGSKKSPNDPCDPRVSTGPLYRCPVEEFCNVTNERWPDQNEVNRAVAATPYDSESYSRYSKSGFRNFLEGFEIVDIEDCDRNEVLCSCGIRRRLHNSVHIILGIGDLDQMPDQSGTMADVAGAANDPIFFNHHCMIDNIFEMWLGRNRKTSYAPTKAELDVTKLGHRAEDVIVPFIPLYTNEQLFKPASEFGYEYSSSTSLSKGKTAKIMTGWVAGLILMLLMA